MNSRIRWWIYSDFAISLNQWEFKKKIGNDKWLRELSFSFYFLCLFRSNSIFFRVFTSKLLFLSRELTFYSLSSSRAHFILRELFTIFYASSLRIHYLLREMKSPRSRINFQRTIYFRNSLSIHFEFTIFFAHSFIIHFLFREFTLDSLAFSRIRIYSLSSSRIHYWSISLLREFTLNSL